MRGFWVILGAGAMALGTAAAADPVDGRTARKLAFDPSGVEVTVIGLDVLSDKDRAALDYVARQQAYYAAIAIAPSEGLMSNATVAAANYHDVDSARAAALKGCDSARKGGKPCVIAAEVRPLGWEPRALSLSADATVGLRKQYGRDRGAKALAISPATGIWTVAKGPGAEAGALDACNAKAAPKDCRIAVADR